MKLTALRLPSTIFAITMLASCSITPPSEPQDIAEKEQKIAEYSGKKEVATLAGGCFWCTEADMEKLPGVITAISGFAGGEETNPAYKEVASGDTGHREAVQVTFDPEIISYRELVDYHLRHIDPTDDGGQFVDRGFQYSSAIFYHSEEQKAAAEAAIQELEESDVFDESIVTPVVPYTTFYPAEDYHQDYYKENSLRYKFYRNGSGRDQFLEETWGDSETVEQ